MRPVDEPIPPDEKLFRSVHHTEIDGDALDPTSIELPASSVNRSKYAPEPIQVLQEGHTGVAVTTPGKLPPPMTSPGGVAHEIRAEDEPSQGDHHAELRVRRAGQAYDASYKPNSKPFKLDLRRAIAGSFEILIAPQPPDEPVE